jgi:hypothetical protein
LETRNLGLVELPEHEDDREFALDLSFGADVLLMLAVSQLGGFEFPGFKLLLGPLLSSYDPLSPCTRNKDPLSALRSILTFWSIL